MGTKAQAEMRRLRRLGATEAEAILESGEPAEGYSRLEADWIASYLDRLLGSTGDTAYRSYIEEMADTGLPSDPYYRVGITAG